MTPPWEPLEAGLDIEFLGEQVTLRVPYQVLTNLFMQGTIGPKSFSPGDEEDRTYYILEKQNGNE